jgi:serine/alanine adding enzyme
MTLLADDAVQREPRTTRSADCHVVEATVADRHEWESFVARCADATGYHSWGWRDVFQRAFGHTSVYLIARRGDAIDGILPLVQVDSWLFGRSLTSMPFVNYGGIAARSDETARALALAAAERARANGCRHLELRHTGQRLPEHPCRQHKVTMRLRLGAQMWEQFDRKLRNQIRKAEKSELLVERAGAERLDDFYAVFARNMRDLGTPVYTRRLFEAVLETFPDRTRLVIVSKNGAPIAAGLTFRTGTTTEMPWASSLREFNTVCPNHLLYWTVIQAAFAEGCETIDFGRSTPGEGTYHFKRQWGAEAVALHWEYPYLSGSTVPDHGPTNPKFNAAIEVWKRCPLWLANIFGPQIVRGIP